MPKSSRSVTPKASAKTHRHAASAAHKPVAVPLKKVAKNGHKTIAKVPAPPAKPAHGKPANGKAASPAKAANGKPSAPSSLGDKDTTVQAVWTGQP